MRICVTHRRPSATADMLNAIANTAGSDGFSVVAGASTKNGAEG